MRALIINDEDDSTPSINLDKNNNKFEISGISLPEDEKTFYKPVLTWIDDYVKDPNPETIFEVKLTYFNTSSSKVLLELLSKFEHLIDKGLSANIVWNYPEMDEELLETGKEFRSLLKVPFNFVPYVQK